MRLAVRARARAWRIAFLIAATLAAGWASGLLMQLIEGASLGRVLWSDLMLSVWVAVAVWARGRARFHGWTTSATSPPALIAVSSVVAVALVATVVWGLHNGSIRQQSADAGPGDGTVTFGSGGGQWPLPSGAVAVLTSSGHGRWATRPFALRGDEVSAVLSTTGSADFDLVDADSGITASTASCRTSCTAVSWQGPKLAGLYRVQIETPSTDTAWRIVLNETRTPSLEVAAWSATTGFTLLSDGTGPARSEPFQLAGKPAPTGGIALGSVYQVAAPTSFYLVPEGSRLDRKRDLILHVPVASSGGWGAARAAGRYRLVVESDGQWSLSSIP